MTQPEGRKRNTIDLFQEVVQLREVNADLLATLKHTQSILHGDVCQQYADCVEACETARDAIRKAEENDD